MNLKWKLKYTSGGFAPRKRYGNFTKRVVKKVHLFKGYWNILTRALVEATGKSCGWAKDPVKYRKHDGGMMLLKSVNYGKSGNRELQGKRSI